MRPVNLLPPRYRRARATGERRGIGYIALGVLAVLLLMVLGYVLTNNSINDAKDKTAQAQAEQAQAQAKIGQLQAYGTFAQLKTSRESAVSSVASSRFDYERLMRELALVLPHNVYLTAFSASGAAPAAGATPGTSTGPTLNISGCAPSHEGVATTVVRLRALHNITDVNLTNSSKSGASAAAGATVCRTSWAAVLTLQAESAPTAPAPVPARLGGGQ